MADIYGEAKIRCLKCENVIGIDGVDLCVEEVSSYERNMGPEVFYVGQLEIICPKCRNNIEMEYEVSEYPIGIENDSELHVSGAEVVQYFQYVDVSLKDEIYSFEEQYQLYIPEKKIIIANLNFSASDLISIVAKYPDTLYEIEPREFEELIAEIFSRHGFSVDLTKRTKDGGRDIIAIRSDLNIKSKYIIECKRYAKNKPVSVGLVRSLYGVQMSEGANKSVLVTTSHFTRDAIEFAKRKNTTEWFLDLKAYKEIVKWVKDTDQS